MTSETDENGGDPRSTLASPAPATAPAAMRAGTVVPVALGLVLGIAYLGYAHVQRQITAQHAELQSLKDKIQAMAVAQTRTDVERSQPSISEIQGLQNHVDTLRGRAKPQKEIQGLQPQYSSWAAKTAEEIKLVDANFFPVLSFVIFTVILRALSRVLAASSQRRY
jgi:uncharacterized protein HemX